MYVQSVTATGNPKEGCPILQSVGPVQFTATDSILPRAGFLKVDHVIK